MVATACISLAVLCALQSALSNSSSSPILYVRDLDANRLYRVGYGAMPCVFDGQGHRVAFLGHTAQAGQCVFDWRLLVGAWKTSRIFEIAEVHPGGHSYPQGGARTISISADGRFVAFIKGDRFYIRDTQEKTSRLIGPDDFIQSGQISADGAYVVYSAAAPGADNQIYRRHVKTGDTDVVSSVRTGGLANRSCLSAAISANGRYVAFSSLATNLSPVRMPPDTEGPPDYRGHNVYWRDMETNEVRLVSRGAACVDGNGASNLLAISSDGGYVLFSSFASNLIESDRNGYCDVFLWSKEKQQTERVSETLGGEDANSPSGNATMSADANVIAFVSGATNLVPDDTNGVNDLFVVDRAASRISRASVSENNRQVTKDLIGGVVSPNGQYVAFSSLDRLISFDALTK